MSSAKPTQFICGDLRGTIYDFPEIGDVVEKHIHSEFDTHVTIVARGKLKSQSHDWEKVAEAGQILDFRAGEPHELVALEPNTRVINIIKKFNATPNP